jgi:hypothetical protein
MSVPALYGTASLMAFLWQVDFGLCRVHDTQAMLAYEVIEMCCVISSSFNFDLSNCENKCVQASPFLVYNLLVIMEVCMQRAHEEADALEAKYEERVASEITPVYRKRQSRVAALRREADELRQHFKNALPKISVLRTRQPGELEAL